MSAITNILAFTAKKGSKALAKKKAREMDETIDEIFNKISPFPWDAKGLNKGEDERVRKMNYEWKVKKEEEFKRNQTPIPLSEDEVKELMRSEAYSNKYHPNYEETQKRVRHAWENLYPDDNRNDEPDNYYIWKAVGDGKTRSSHADRDGEVFCWDNPPDGGHPGKDYGCRCTAKPYIPPKNLDKH